MSRKIGALWLRESKDGTKKYMSGIIEDLSGDIQIVVFRNDKKEKENQPDYQILLSEKREERKPVSDPIFGASDGQKKDYKEYNGEATPEELAKMDDKPNFMPNTDEQDSIDVNKIPF